VRSPAEIWNRLWQELLNVWLWKAPPRLTSDCSPPAPLPKLPAPSKVVRLLSGTAFPDELRRYAGEIMAHRFPVLGLTLKTGTEILWRKDYVNGPETGCTYFRRIPYLDPARAGDHKIVWELNRHQHLVLLAQLYQFDCDPALLEEIWAQLKSWIDENPFQMSINWTSALEVAFRAQSWIWIYHLVGNHMPAPLRRAFLEALMLHGRHLEVNLSFYFSPNTHLIGEAVALHALGVLFSDFPRSRHWAELGARVVERQIELQVRDDGAHFEQSTFYHLYALDMFLFHAILAAPGDAYRSKLARMSDYLAAVQGPSRVLPLIGDDDGGRFFHPFGPRDQFGRATIAASSAFLGNPQGTYTIEDLYPIAAWWLGCAENSASVPISSHLFANTGVAVMTSGDVHILADAGPFGPWGSGHSHSDTLSLVIRSRNREILIDPGTYTYVGDPSARDWFRGSSAHSTIRVDGIDQATPVNPFRWKDQPSVSIREWASSETEDLLDAECRFGNGFTHRRRFRFLKPGLLLIADEISGPPGEHVVEQFWHLGFITDRDRFSFGDPAEVVESWRSPAFGMKFSSPALRISKKTILPVRLGTAILLDGLVEPVGIEIFSGKLRFSCRNPLLIWLDEPSA
jgi:hypothetical protein